MRVFLASDHAGFDLKNSLLFYLRAAGHEAEDLGPGSLEPQDDYPDFIVPLARKVAGASGSMGIVIGGSGQGEAMAANRIKGVRAAVYYGGGLDIVKIAREHNNANILSLGARFITEAEAEQAVSIFLTTLESTEERHRRRIEKLDHD